VPNGPGELVEDEEYQRDDGELGYAVGIDVRRRRRRGVPCTPRPLEWRALAAGAAMVSAGSAA